MKKLCVITGSRAEYGLLRPVIRKIRKDDRCKLQLIVTGMHLDIRQGLTVKEIEQDEIPIDEKIEINVASDSAVGICKSMGLGMIGFGEAYERLRPDMIILLGDRYEMLAAASAACVSKIPIAHIHGGEVTIGAYDDCIRHAITKMSYLHFTSTKEYQNRVIQLGEAPDRVYQVGALGIENIKDSLFLSKGELEEQLNISLQEPFVLVTFHPVTLDDYQMDNQIQILFQALDSFPKLQLIFTNSNSDTGGSQINNKIEEYVRKNKNRAVVFTFLGSRSYLSLIKYSQAVIGNSSSGILEAPFLKIPAVDIGDRQKGRVKPYSVISVEHSSEGIIQGIESALRFQWKKRDYENPYEKEGTSDKILEIIKETLDQGIVLKKGFYDWS